MLTKVKIFEAVTINVGYGEAVVCSGIESKIAWDTAAPVVS